MSFDEWLDGWCPPEGTEDAFYSFDLADMRDSWNAAYAEGRKTLIADLYRTEPAAESRPLSKGWFK